MSTDYHAVVISRVGEAGRTLMLLPSQGILPAGSRSHMPEVVRRYWDLWGGLTEDERKRIARERNRTRVIASASAIGRLDEVLDWLWLISDKHQRRAVTGRMPVWPENGRHVNSWRQMGRASHVHHETVRRWHKGGIEAIVLGLARG